MAQTRDTPVSVTTEEGCIIVDASGCALTLTPQVALKLGEDLMDEAAKAIGRHTMEALDPHRR